ncbi:MAG: T9SS type A sorting domain-containing protein [Bacteroidetes bacterium]|nr:T9SS type A sorting domain-containing protein [Bacteroidota bacterium]
MQRSVSVSVCALFLAAVLAVPSVAQPTFEQLSGPNAMLGTEFWIAFPPNELPGYPVTALEIYGTSPYDTEITIYEAETQKQYKRTLKAGEIRTLSDSRGETNWSWEVRNAEVVEPKAIRITSLKPISLYVLNSKVFTSDGYMAIPTKLWDTNYVAVAYYDFREIKNWSGGFLIISKEDNTRVTIDLKGQGEGDAKTSRGRSINTGIPFTVTLDKGMTYMVQGDGTTRAVFDLTGTSITSTKPIGVLGFHQRTTMPNMLQNGNGRNHLVEMIPPVSAWGKRYATVALDRQHNGAGRGDMFRVIASQKQTRVKYEFFDKDTKKKLGGSGFVLNKPGDFIDISQSSDPVSLPEGVSIWTADKPIFVVQYSCSSSWDGDITLDPFMVNLTPVEQYCKATMFQCPTLSAFTSHDLNLIVQVDTTSPTLIDDLKSITIDGKSTWNDSRAKSPTLLFNRIASTDLYWTTINFPTDSKSHTITSNGSVHVGGIIYGYGQTDAYGWPLAAQSKDLTDTNFIDTLPPVLTKSGTPKRMQYTATDVRMQADPSTPAPFALTQRPTGIAAAGLINNPLKYTSTNYTFTFTSDSSFPRVNPSMLTTFVLSVVDTTRNAVAYFSVMDWAGNVKIDSLRYVKAGATQDTMRPVFFKTGSSLALSVTATELRNIPDPPRTPAQAGDQVETGLAAIGLVSNDTTKRSSNYLLTYGTDSTLGRTPAYTSFIFTLTVQDTTAPAVAYYYAMDGAGNTTIDSVRYKPTTTAVVEERTGDQPFTLAAFPHPALGVATLRWTPVGTSAVGTIRVTDLQGRQVWEGSTAEGATEAAISISALASGTYIIGLVIDGHTAGTTLHLMR